jgi:hypothetical protein
MAVTADARRRSFRLQHSITAPVHVHSTLLFAPPCHVLAANCARELARPWTQSSWTAGVTLWQQRTRARPVIIAGPIEARIDVVLPRREIMPAEVHPTQHARVCSLGGNAGISPVHRRAVLLSLIMLRSLRYQRCLRLVLIRLCNLLHAKQRVAALMGQGGQGAGAWLLEPRAAVPVAQAANRIGNERRLC